MSLATLDVLNDALRRKGGVAGFVVLGWEEARAFVAAGEAEQEAIILQAGPACRAHTPLSVLGPMFETLAKNASIPVVCHLDHAKNFEECRIAIECGFSSVMIDGSREELKSNCDLSAQVVQYAHRHGVTVEGEIGFVGYAGGAGSQATDPEEAHIFEKESGIDAMAIAIGNTHLQEQTHSEINWQALRQIEAVTRCPLVLHGGSGITAQDRQALARTSRVAKFNIGTELRMAFGHALRAFLSTDPEVFDRISILKSVEQPLTQQARLLIRQLASHA